MGELTPSLHSLGEFTECLWHCSPQFAKTLGLYSEVKLSDAILMGAYPLVGISPLGAQRGLKSPT